MVRALQSWLCSLAFSRRKSSFSTFMELRSLCAKAAGEQFAAAAEVATLPDWHDSDEEEETAACKFADEPTLLPQPLRRSVDFGDCGRAAGRIAEPPLRLSGLRDRDPGDEARMWAPPAVFELGSMRSFARSFSLSAGSGESSRGVAIP
mmetsp:Transcript_6425/g.10330  ORF Transcript_6425/g.10330 Transcript_6425/m.10330 type:complete len:149 (-) Transcript_6425:38-484(-)